MPVIHPRYFIVEKARLELSKAILEILQRNDLTHLEAIKIQTFELEKTIMYALRSERHPENPDKKADEQ